MNLTAQNWPAEIEAVIPAYRASDSLTRFLPRLLELVPAARIIVVDDASYDSTGMVCDAAGVRCIQHVANRGKGAALRTGFAEALRDGAEWVLTMDADGQHAIKDIQALVETAGRDDHQGLIIGARTIHLSTMPLARIFSNTVTSAILSQLCGTRILDSQSGFRLYSMRLLEQITLYWDRFEMESEVILRAAYAGFRITFVPIQTLYCSDKSHISHLRDTLRWLRAVTGTWLELKRKQT